MKIPSSTGSFNSQYRLFKFHLNISNAEEANVYSELEAELMITNDFDLSWDVKIGNKVVNFKQSEILKYQLRYTDDSGSEILPERGDLKESLKSMILYEFYWPVSK